MLVARALVVLLLLGLWGPAAALPAGASPVGAVPGAAVPGTAVPGAVVRAAAGEGPWGWPLVGPHSVARPFAPPASTYGAGHRGADLPSVEGAAVRASAAGRITYAGLLAGRGVVVVTHGALRTTYEPVVAAVRVGQVVALGEVVGRLSAGHAGCPVAACLHWGLRRGEEYLDPVRLVERGPLRLLPLTGVGRGLTGGVRSATGRGAVDGATGASGPDVGEPVPPAAAGPAGAPAPRGPASAPVSAMPVAPAEVDEPSWSVRAAEAPMGAVAVAALVLGVGLLARPRPGPDGPVSGGVAAVAVTPDEPEAAGPPGLLLDLEQARARRSA